MAQFRGIIQGQRGEASRLGSKASGLTVEAASWQGKIEVRLWHDETAGRDLYEVTQERHHGSGVRQVLASGVVGMPATSADCYPRHST